MPTYSYTRVSRPSAPAFFKFKNMPLLIVGVLADSGAMAKPKAYIDTGAQYCLFNNAYAAPLGIKDFKCVQDESHIVPLSGIGGTHTANTAYFHDLKLVVFKDQRKLNRANALVEISTKIGFLEKPISFAGILGVYGFLDHFSFTANIPEKYFELEPILT